ncbi:unnamed protein product [Linum trigynum]|uniref:Uncharacterized protein n=1 Tax=Linum trigynum TaxID=586398 RepID=A0AAV2DQT0_9ROSI
MDWIRKFTTTAQAVAAWSSRNHHGNAVRREEQLEGESEEEQRRWRCAASSEISPSSSAASLEPPLLRFHHLLQYDRGSHSTRSLESNSGPSKPAAMLRHSQAPHRLRQPNPTSLRPGFGASATEFRSTGTPRQCNCELELGKTFALPELGVTFETHGGFEALLGFGFNSSTNDYKVVRVVRLLEYEEIAIEVEVFSLNVGSWKTITSTAPQYNIVERGSQAFGQRVGPLGRDPARQRRRW